MRLTKLLFSVMVLFSCGLMLSLVTAQSVSAQNVASEKEQLCFDIIQGKVAWNRDGNKSWATSNLRNLCSNTQDPWATRDCFTRSIKSGNGWDVAIDRCKTTGNSFQVQNTPRPAPSASASVVTLYEHCNYKGYSVTLPVGAFGLSSLEAKGIKNDDISSIRVTPGYKVDIFQDDRYRGAKRSLEGNTSCLTTYGMNDKLSSIRVLERSTSSAPRPTTRPAPAPRPRSTTSNKVATLYEHCNYKGYSVSLPVGAFNLSRLESKGAKNDDISSIKVTPGYKVEVFQDTGYRGAKRSLEGNISCLSSYGMNDKLSSIRVSERSRNTKSGPSTTSRPTITSRPTQAPSASRAGNMVCICTAENCGSGCLLYTSPSPRD